MFKKKRGPNVDKLKIFTQYVHMVPVYRPSLALGRDLGILIRGRLASHCDLCPWPSEIEMRVLVWNSDPAQFCHYNY